MCTHYIRCDEEPTASFGGTLEEHRSSASTVGTQRKARNSMYTHKKISSRMVWNCCKTGRMTYDESQKPVRKQADAERSRLENHARQQHAQRAAEVECFEVIVRQRLHTRKKRTQTTHTHTHTHGQPSGNRTRKNVQKRKLRAWNLLLPRV